jgi:hypothetical protein
MKCLCYYLVLFIVVCLTADIQAQVPVAKEPHHKTVLLNNYVRLIDVHLNPHDTTMYHIVFISKSLMGTQDMSGKGLPSGEVLPGQTLFRDYEKEPVTHRVYNSGDNVFHVMDIELEKKGPSPDSCLALQQGNIETTINEKLARVYKFDLKAQAPLNISKSSCAYLLICIAGEIKTAGKKIKTGEYIFFDPNKDFSINNNQSSNSLCVLIQLN